MFDKDSNLDDEGDGYVWEEVEDDSELEDL
jgi:hypothetical protein